MKRRRMVVNETYPDELFYKNGLKKSGFDLLEWNGAINFKT